MLVHQWRSLDIKTVTGNLVTAQGVREKTIGGQSQCKKQHNLIQAEKKHLSTVMAGVLTGHLSFLSPWEQTIAARISLKVATKDKSIGRAILLGNISDVFTGGIGINGQIRVFSCFSTSNTIG